MKVLVTLALAAAATANTQVNWYGCSGESAKTSAASGDCTNVSGFKTTNLCEVWVPPPGTDRCEFYTTPCLVPGGTTYYCSVGSGKCNARPWSAIRAYRCYS